MMMDGSCGVLMTVMMGLGGLLGLALLASVIVLAWAVIGRLRRRGRPSLENSRTMKEKSQPSLAQVL